MTILEKTPEGQRGFDANVPKLNIDGYEQLTIPDVRGAERMMALYHNLAATIALDLDAIEPPVNRAGKLILAWEHLQAMVDNNELGGADAIATHQIYKSSTEQL